MRMPQRRPVRIHGDVKVSFWNTCRPPLSSLRKFGGEIKTRGLGAAVMFLQEVPNVLHGRYIGKGLLYGGRQSTTSSSKDNNVDGKSPNSFSYRGSDGVDLVAPMTPVMRR